MSHNCIAFSSTWLIQILKYTHQTMVRSVQPHLKGARSSYRRKSLVQYGQHFHHDLVHGVQRPFVDGSSNDVFSAISLTFYFLLCCAPGTLILVPFSKWSTTMIEFLCTRNFYRGRTDSIVCGTLSGGLGARAYGGDRVCDRRIPGLKPKPNLG